jgi:hypothetical protein
MPILLVRLTSGVDLRACQIFQSETYEGGLAIGVHNEERVMKHIEIIKKSLQPLIPTCPMTVLAPRDLASRRRWCLPFYTCVTWFTSDFLHDANRCGSHLATIHFQDTVQPYFSAENDDALRAIDWPALATDFDY